MFDRSHPLSELDVSPRILKRAQYEALAFFIRPPYVEVRNYSYPDPAEHTYRVRIADGLPVNCSCPADIRYDRACKHRVGVAIRRRLLEMVTEARVAADGAGTTDPDGQPVERDDPADEAQPTDCECHPDEQFPCWPCVQAGRQSLPTADEPDEQC